VIPKLHIPSVDAITAENSGVIAHVYEVIARLAAELGLKNGYRVVTNCGSDGGQSVAHLHFHVLAGRELAWPPG
ncbi:MAG: HIT domain-containing protein, partial [Ruthenibacterium sp.]